ncbi:uncharacterized protein METZ01_LOCUS333706, partial [marine metagenome]
EIGDGSGGAGDFSNPQYGAGINNNGIWHHLVWVIDGNDADKYSDGTNLGSNAHSYNFSDNASMPLILGGGRGQSGIAHYLEGKMKKVRIYLSALTASQISDIYDTGHDGDAASSSTVSSAGSVAGQLNFDKHGFIMENCQSNASLTANTTTGGLVGNWISAGGIDTKTGTLRDSCYVGNMVKSFKGRAGGLIGSSDKGIDTIQRCYSAPAAITVPGSTEISSASQSHPGSTDYSGGWLIGYKSADWTLSQSTIADVYYNTFAQNTLDANVYDINGVIVSSQGSYTEVLSAETEYDENTVTVIGSPPSVTGSTMSVTFDIKNTSNESGYVIWRGDSS